MDVKKVIAFEFPEDCFFAKMHKYPTLYELMKQRDQKNDQVKKTAASYMVNNAV